MAETDTTQTISRVLASFGSVHDSSAIIDVYVNTILARLRAGTPGAGLSDRLYDEIGKNVTWALGGKPYTKIEHWLLGLPPVFVYKPEQSTTKYDGVSYMIWGQTDHVIGGTLNIAGTFVGTDKLGHFFQQGYEYFCNSSNATANERYGRRTEIGKFGLLTTGVYSNADLEANRKGCEFYKALSATPALNFRITDYVTSKWNEETNPSFYGVHIAPQVWSNLLTGRWRGRFAEGAAPIPISATLRAQSNGSIAGTFTWRSASGTVNGTLRGNYKLLVCHMGSGGAQEVLLGSLVDVPYPRATIAATGLLIHYDWTSGAKKGRGYWRTSGERRLQGEWVEGNLKMRDHWGGGTSLAYDGTWVLERE